MKSMTKRRSFLVIGAVAAVHFVLTFAVVVNHLACEGRPGRLSAWSDVLGELLGLPLGLVSRFAQWRGYDLNELVRHVPGGLFVLLIVNSVLAALILWFIAVKLVKRRKRSHGHPPQAL